MSHPARRARAAAAFGIGILLTLAGCADGRDVASLTGVRAPVVSLPVTIDEQVKDLITRLWPASTGTTATSLLGWWELIKRKTPTRNAEARQYVVDVIALMNGRADKAVALPNETVPQTIAHISLLMSTYVYGGPQSEPPDVPPSAEATLAVVHPAEETTVQTPSEEGGVTFPAGSVNTPTVVVITRTDASLYPDECSGPLPTRRCQYPAFYKFNVFPDVRLNTPALVAVCREENGDTRMPRADHDRFRLAHQKPDDPAAYNPEGYIEGDIEILPLRPAGNVVDCPSEPEEGEGGLASALRRLVTPRLLYAIDRGGGGAVFMFSDFAMIDPLSRPDVFAPGYFSASLASVSAGQAMSVTFNMANDGSGSGGAFENRIVLATNATLTAGAVELAVLPVPGGIIPNPGVVIGPNVVTIPAGTAPGSYWIGVRLDAGNALDEEDEANNVSATMITVTADDVTLVDQVNDPPTGTSISCGNDPPFGSIYQGFTPTGALLTAVELRIRDGGGFPAEGVSSTVQIRSGGPSGPVLGSRTIQLAPGGTGVQRLVRYTFATPLTLTPGSLYVIELMEVRPIIYSWMGSTEGNPYPGGITYGCTGNEIPDWDMNFRTFGSGQVYTPDNVFNLTARGTATIDGQLGTAEWANSVCKLLTVNTPGGGTTPATVCVMSDAANFYVSLVYDRGVSDPGHTLAIELDGEGNANFLHDTFLQTTTNFVDGFRTETLAPMDTEFGSTNDGAGALNRSIGTRVVYEMRHPLNSGDIRDIAKAPGQQLRFNLSLRMIAAGGTFPTGFGDTAWPGPSIFTFATVNLAP